MQEHEIDKLKRYLSEDYFNLLEEISLNDDEDKRDYLRSYVQKYIKNCNQEEKKKEIKGRLKFF